MKLILALCLVAMASAAPQAYQGVQLYRSYNDNDGYGNYRFGYDQSDGQFREEIGELKNSGRENEYIAVRGSYSWISPDGWKYTVTYIADDNGYQPEPLQQQPPGAPVSAAVCATCLG